MFPTIKNQMLAMMVTESQWRVSPMAARVFRLQSGMLCML